MYILKIITITSLADVDVEAHELKWMSKDALK